MIVEKFYIAPSSYSVEYYKKNATVADTLKLIHDYATTCGYQVEDIARKLHADTVEGYCRNIWNFVKENIAYKEDKKGVEQVRQPARTWADRETGVDCDCYTTFISALLHLKNISHDYRVVSWTGKAKWAHIYPVAYDQNGNSFAIDCIPEISRFNQQLKFTDKMDLEGLAGSPTDAEIMEQAITVNGYDTDSELGEYEDSRVEVLNGMEEADPSEPGAIRFNGAQLAALNEQDALETLHGAIMTLKAEEENNTELSGIADVPQELKYAGGLVMNWKDTSERDSILKKLSENSKFSEFYANIRKQLEAGAELKGINESYFIPFEGYHDDEEGLGKFRPFKKVRSKLKNVKNKIGKTKVGKFLRKVRKAVNKVSPQTIALRNGMLLVMKKDIGGVATFLKKGMYSPQEAKARGISDQEYQESKAKYARVLERFDRWGGKENNLRNAITRGKAGALAGIEDSNEELGVAPLVAAALSIVKGIIGIGKKRKEKKEAEALQAENQAGESNDSTTEENSESAGTTTNEQAPSKSKRTVDSTSDTDTTEPTVNKNDQNLTSKTMAEQKATTDTPVDDRPFLKRIWQDHKWWVIGGTIGLVLLIVFVLWMIKRSKKKKSGSLAGRRRQMSVYARPAYRRRSAPKALQGGPLMLAGPRKKKKRAVAKKRKR